MIAIGDIFSQLTVVEIMKKWSSVSKRYHKYAKCKCSCGKITIVNIQSLKRGKTRSCGHLKKESKPGKIHGFYKTRIYNIWHSMIQRVTNKNNPSYKNYGGRGISIPENWSVFKNFFNDMGQPPSTKHTLERVNNDKGYSKNNCIWAIRSVQLLNSRDRKSTLPRGVVRNKKSFTARIYFKGKCLNLGYYTTAKEAHQIYLKRRNKILKEYNDKYKE